MTVKKPHTFDDMRKDLHACIFRGIDFLFGNQLPHGEFPSYRIYTRQGAGNWDLDSAVFPTALIAYCLRFLEGPKVRQMRSKAKTFLFREMQPPGLWRYWTERSGLPIIPDLDDTCCAGAVLLEDKPGILAKNASTILNNRDERGLFYTFFKSGTDPDNDVDSVVNANVLFYLKAFDGIEKVVDYLYAVISENREEGSYWYYLTPASLYYMIGRAYANGAKRLEIFSPLITTRIMEHRLAREVFGDEIDAALDLCSLINFGTADFALIRTAAADLMRRQQEDGSWQRHRFYAGPPPPGTHTVWFGSEAMTTAFCLEALARVADSWI